MSDKFDPAGPVDRIGYRILHVLWVIGLTLAVVIGLVYAYIYFITYGALAGSSGLDGTGQTSKIYNNFEEHYYPGVLGQLRLARTEGHGGRDADPGQDR